MKLFSALPLLAAVATVAGAHSEGGSKGMGSAPSSEGGSKGMGSEGGSKGMGSEGGSKGMGSEGGSKGMGSSSMAMGPTDPFTATFDSYFGDGTCASEVVTIVDPDVPALFCDTAGLAAPCTFIHKGGPASACATPTPPDQCHRYFKVTYNTGCPALLVGPPLGGTLDTAGLYNPVNGVLNACANNVVKTEIQCFEPVTPTGALFPQQLVGTYMVQPCACPHVHGSKGMGGSTEGGAKGMGGSSSTEGGAKGMGHSAAMQSSTSVESTTAGLVSLSAVVFVAGVGLLVARRVRARSADVSEKMTLLNTDEGVVV